MRVLYKRTLVEIPEDFIPSEVQKDILDNWHYHYNLFSVTQIAERNNKSRGHVQRKVKGLVKLGIVERHTNNVNSSGLS